MNRRGFLTGLACAATAVPALAQGPQRKGKGNHPAPAPVTPPGAVSIEHLLAHCTGCGLCVAKCPHQAIVPSKLEYGLRGMMMPRMDYAHGFCDYHCHVCSHVCPAGALLPLGHDEKLSTKIGEAFYIQHHCVVETDKVTCGICAEHCPAKAITMVKAADGRPRPQIDTSKCIGCGTCEYYCPAKHKAIRVRGLAKHERIHA